MTTDQPLLQAGTEAPDDRARLRPSFVVTFMLAAFGLWMTTLTPVIVSLPLKVAQLDPRPATQGVTLSAVLGIGALFGILANPLFGRISDRTTWRAGMRRPWLVIGAVLSFAGGVVLGVAPSVPVAIAGWAICEVGINATMAVLLALVPDQVPPHRRGTVSGLIGLTQALAAMIGTGIVSGLSRVSLTAAIVVPTVIALVLVTLAAIVLRDRRLDPADRPPFDAGAFVRSFWVNPRRHRDFGWAWISRFALFMAISLVLNYQVYYLTTHLGLPTAAATALLPAAIGIETVLVVLVSLTLGPLSDRLGRRRVFVLIAALITGLGLAIAALAPAAPTSAPLFLVAMGVIGAGQGTYLAIDLALVAEVLPDRRRDAAKDLGVLGLAGLIPQSLAPAIAPLFLLVPALGGSAAPGENYTALFLAGVVFALLSAAGIARVRGVR